MTWSSVCWAEIRVRRASSGCVRASSAARCRAEAGSTKNVLRKVLNDLLGGRSAERPLQRRCRQLAALPLHAPATRPRASRAQGIAADHHGQPAGWRPSQARQGVRNRDHAGLQEASSRSAFCRQVWLSQSLLARALAKPGSQVRVVDQSHDGVRRAPADRRAARARRTSRARAPARSGRPRWRRWRVPRPCIRRAWSASRRTRHRRLAGRAARPGCRRRQDRRACRRAAPCPVSRTRSRRLDQRAQRTVADEQKARPRAGFEHALDRRGQGWDAVPDAKRAREADDHGPVEPEPPPKLRRISRGLELLGIDAVRVDQDFARSGTPAASRSRRSGSDTTTTRSAARRLMRSTSAAARIRRRPPQCRPFQTSELLNSSIERQPQQARDDRAHAVEGRVALIQRVGPRVARGAPDRAEERRVVGEVFGLAPRGRRTTRWAAQPASAPRRRAGDRTTPRARRRPPAAARRSRPRCGPPTRHPPGQATTGAADTAALRPLDSVRRRAAGSADRAGAAAGTPAARPARRRACVGSARAARVLAWSPMLNGSALPHRSSRQRRSARGRASTRLVSSRRCWSRSVATSTASA